MTELPSIKTIVERAVGDEFVAAVRGRKMTPKKARKMAVDAMECRRRAFNIGYYAYLGGYKSIWTERDYKKYMEMSEAIEVIEKGTG